MTTIPPEVPAGADAHARAEQTIDTLRKEVEIIDGFGHPAPERRRKIAAAAANITDAELNAAAGACDAHPELAAAAQMTGTEFRAGISFCTANTKLRDQLLISAAGVTYAVNLKRADLANRARRVYQIAQSLNKPADRELLIPHVESLREAFKRPRKRAAAPAPTPPATPAAPVTPPVTAAPPAATPPAPNAPAPAVAPRT